jgi:hypothetical protein
MRLLAIAFLLCAACGGPDVACPEGQMLLRFQTFDYCAAPCQQQSDCAAPEFCVVLLNQGNASVCMEWNAPIILLH